TFNHEQDKKPALTINYIAPDENSIYAYLDCADVSKVKVSNTTYKAEKRKYAFPAGSYPEGEKFSFDFVFVDSFKSKASITFLVYTMDEQLFEMGMEKLRDESFEIDEYKSTKLKGSINAKENGVFYTSIPYEKGWKLYIDGERTDIEPLEDAFITAYLTKGEHEIVLKYSPYGFTLGVVISVCALIIFVLAVVISRRRKNG
ncbi:MAG: YfhO family protein, partial [Clostridia bacterium]|nr:YfhO family protein [Clostridia bacterium]